jgi:LuxR family maltose regulon positive regulatory protein
VATKSRRADNLLAEELLATKLLVPAVGPEVLSRPRVAARLAEASRRRLTVVSAPAGFGKTTAVAAWIAGSALPIAWLTLDESDNDLGRFLAYVVGAVRRRSPQLGAEALQQLARMPLRLPVVLASLLNDVAALSDPLILVLDDFEAVQSQEVLDALAFLIEHQPPNLHHVICSRAEPRLPLARLRARGQLVEIGVDDLRFTPEEAARFLEQATSKRLSPEGSHTLHARTEGWIAGLQLAALSLRRTADYESFIASFAGDHRHVAGYLVDEVLRHEPPAVQEFLLATSVLRKLTGDLCDAVTGEGGATRGEAMLAQLAASNLFVQPLDEQQRWYRYHGLFAELLRHRLDARDPAAAPRLHRRAATWLDEHGLVGEAIHHALAGGDSEWAARLAERHGHLLLGRGEHRAVVAWLSRLPAAAFAHHPGLGAVDALARLAARDVDGAARRLASVERRIAELPAPPPVLVFSLRVAAAAVCLLRGDATGALALAAETDTLGAEPPPSLAGALETVMALGHHARGELGEARRFAERGLAAGVAEESPRPIFLLGALLARIDLVEGRLRRAETEARELLSLAVKNSWWEVSFRTAPQLVLAEALYERGALAEAEEVLASAHELAARLGPDEHEDLAAEWLTRVRLALGAAPAAAHRDLGRAAQQDFFLHLFEAPVVHRLSWELDAGDARGVEAELRRRGIEAQARALEPGREREYLLLARSLVARGRAVDALPLLGRLVLAAEAEGRRGTAIAALALQAVARHQQGSVPPAREALGRALELAGEEGYVRAFVDLGAPMLQLLRHAATVAPGEAAIERLLAAFAAAPAAAPPATAPLGTPIRERELDVLRCLSAGMSQPEVAAQLYLSPNTVKTHVRNIYGKLGVQSRSQALRRARELRLIP